MLESHHAKCVRILA